MCSDNQDRPPGEWGPNRASVAIMRLHKTAEAYKTHDLLTALVEAEELLDDDPNNVAALEILGDTELDLGHGREAELVFTKLVSLVPATASYLGGLAVARFLSADFQGSLDAGREALKMKPDLVEAIAYVGLSLERLGRTVESRAYLRKAARLDPESYPLPVPLERVPWNALLRAALKRIPTVLHFFFEQVPVVWHHFPDPAVLRSVDPPVSPMVLALYEGSPPDGAGEESPNGRMAPVTDESEDLGDGALELPILPRSIRIYKGNISRHAHNMKRLVTDLAQALTSEATDWLGLPFPEEGEE